MTPYSWIRDGILQLLSSTRSGSTLATSTLERAGRRLREGIISAIGSRTRPGQSSWRALLFSLRLSFLNCLGFGGLVGRSWLERHRWERDRMEGRKRRTKLERNLTSPLLAPHLASCLQCFRGEGPLKCVSRLVFKLCPASFSLLTDVRPSDQTQTNTTSFVRLLFRYLFKSRSDLWHSPPLYRSTTATTSGGTISCRS